MAARRRAHLTVEAYLNSDGGHLRNGAFLCIVITAMEDVGGLCTFASAAVDQSEQN